MLFFFTKILKIVIFFVIFGNNLSTTTSPTSLARLCSKSPSHPHERCHLQATTLIPPRTTLYTHLLGLYKE